MPEELMPTPEQEKEALVFASALALTRLGQAMHKNEMSVKFSDLDSYIREILAEFNTTDEEWQNTYFEYVCVQIAVYENLDAPDEQKQEEVQSVISQIMGVAIPHVMRLDYKIDVGVVPHPDDLEIPKEWLEGEN